MLGDGQRFSCGVVALNSTTTSGSMLLRPRNTNAVAKPTGVGLGFGKAECVLWERAARPLAVIFRWRTKGQWFHHLVPSHLTYDGRSHERELEGYTK